MSRHIPGTFQQVYLNDASLNEKLNTSQPIAFFIHGYLESYRHSMYVKITEEYQKYIESNFCVVDWRNLAYMKYNLSVQQTERVGNYTADFIRSLIETKHFTIDDIKLFGFSLGAHVAGFTGASLNGEVPLIIGLDPAGPRFTKPPEFIVGNHLNPTNAKFVQVIHTDRMIFGAQNAIGHADYYPNDAINPQPGCNLIAFPEMITCSHTRSRDIFLASLNPENKFISYECDSYQKYSQGLCTSHSSDVLGVHSKLVLALHFHLVVQCNLIIYLAYLFH